MESRRRGGQQAKKGTFALAVAGFFDQGTTLGSGLARMKNDDPRDFLINGRAKPGTIVSHRSALTHTPDGYKESSGASMGRPRC